MTVGFGMRVRTTNLDTGGLVVEPITTTSETLAPTILSVALQPGMILPNVSAVSVVDTINLGSEAVSRPLFNVGISQQRPEVIVVHDFKPAYNSDQLPTNVGKFLNVTVQTNVLRRNTARKIIDFLKQKSPDTIRNLELSASSTRTETSRRLASFNARQQALRSLRLLFDVKTLDRSLFGTGPGSKSLVEFAEANMLYDRSAIEKFSDTKLLLQMLIDARNSLEAYSLNLLNSNDSDRGSADSNSISLDHTVGDLPSIKLTTLKQKGLFEETSFRKATTELPTGLVDRLKLQVYFLSKELRVSSGLGDPQLKNRLEFFGSSPEDSNTFDNVFGIPGKDVLEKPSGISANNSLVSLFRLEGNNTATPTVLPFERKFIDDGQTSFVPGIKFFIDSAFNSPNPDSTPFANYTERFSDVVFAAKGLTEGLLGLSVAKRQGLLPEKLCLSFLSSIKSALIEATPNQMLCLGVLKAANKNFALKFHLFQFLLLLGISTLEPTNQRGIFRKLAQELTSVKALSSVRLETSATEPNINGGLSELSLILNQVARDMEFRVLYGDRSSLGGSQPPVVTSQTVQLGLAGTSRNSVDFSSQTQPTVGIVAGTTTTTAELSGTPTQSAGSTPSRFIFQPGTLKTVLVSGVLSDGNASTTLFKEFLDIANETMSLVDETHVTSTNSLLTRYNKLTPSGLLFLVFGTLVDIVDRFFDASLTIEGTNIRVSVNEQRNRFVLAVINTLLSSGVSTVTPTSRSNNTSNLQNQRTNSTEENLVFSAVGQGAVVQPPRRNNRLVPGSTPMNTGNLTSLNDQQPSPEVFGQAAQSGFGTVVGTVSQALPETNVATTLSPEDLSLFGSDKVTLEEVINKLKTEELHSKNVFHILEVVGDGLKRGKDKIASLFSNESKQDHDSGNNHRTHLLTSTWAFNNLSNSNSVVQTMVGEWFAVEAMLKTHKFTNPTNNLKVLAIGIPTGFSDHVSEHITTLPSNNTANNLETNNEVDVVSINVYKKSNTQPNDVYKPLKFLFDLSLFPNKQSIGSISGPLTFASVVERLTLQDLDSSIQFVVSKQSIEQTKPNLTLIQRKQLFDNHVISWLLGAYVGLASGMSLQETTFLATPTTGNSNDSSESFRSVLTTYLIEVKGLSGGIVSSALQSQQQQTGGSVNGRLPAEIKEELKLIAGFGLQDPLLEQRKVLGTKKFERVLLVPVDMNEFITVEGSLEQPSREVVVDDLFVTIEVVS